MKIDAYLDRIGYRGQPAATREALREIHLRHPQTIAFENLDSFLSVTAKLDIDSLEQKLVRGGRGGWCFEQNLLLSQALRSLGFAVRELAARVLWNAPAGIMRPRTHMVLLVEAETERHIVDVGFGGITLTAPLQFEMDVEQRTPHELFRIIEVDEEFIVQAYVQGEWKGLYRFDLQPQTLPDYELTNWYLANHPSSHFRSNLIVARAIPGGRYALLNDQLTIHHVNGDSERRKLSSVAELRNVLAETFLLRLPDTDDLGLALQRIFSG